MLRPGTRRRGAAGHTLTAIRRSGGRPRERRSRGRSAQYDAPIGTDLPAAAVSTAGPCDGPAYRAFDFWLGDWDVHTPEGRLAGTSSIERKHGGCVLHERYTGGRGYSGESLNIYDAARAVWHQTWVDTAGMLLVLEGGLRDGRMVLEGSTMDAAARTTGHRITWSPNPDGTVRQLWESTAADGSWGIAFDGLYTRK